MNLKRIRLSRGLTVPALSRLSDVPVRTIENIERDGTCKVATAIKLADALEITLDELCRKENKMTIDMMIKKNGKTSYDGKTYVLTQQAYIDGPVDADPYYKATAICPEDGINEDGLYDVYDITWYPTQEWLDSDRDDEGWACDWDAPENVRKTNLGYDLADDSVVY